MAIQIKRTDEATRINSNVVLESGQPLYETDTKLLYIGDGTTEAKNLQSVNSKLNIKNGTAVATIDGQQVSGGSVISASLYDDDAVYTEEQLPVASGHESFAWGKNCKALGKRCLAFGNGAQATGNTSIALGQTLLNDRNGAFVTGQGHITHREYQTIVGRYADSAGNSDKMFQVGNGADDSNRHDAFAVVSGSYYKNGVTDKNLGYAIAGSTPDNVNEALTRVDWVKNYISEKCAPSWTNDTWSNYILLNNHNVYSSKLITTDATPSTAVLRDANGFIKVGDISDSLITNSSWQDVCTNLKFVRGYTYSKSETDTKDATTLSSAKTYTDTKIDALDYSASGASNKTITSISQTDGKISATFSNISYPVTSVDGKTGDVIIDRTPTPTKDSTVCFTAGGAYKIKSEIDTYIGSIFTDTTEVEFMQSSTFGTGLWFSYPGVYRVTAKYTYGTESGIDVLIFSVSSTYDSSKYTNNWEIRSLKNGSRVTTASNRQGSGDMVADQMQWIYLYGGMNGQTEVNEWKYEKLNLDIL